MSAEDIESQRNPELPMAQSLFAQTLEERRSSSRPFLALGMSFVSLGCVSAQLLTLLPISYICMYETTALATTFFLVSLGALSMLALGGCFLLFFGVFVLIPRISALQHYSELLRSLQGGIDPALLAAASAGRRLSVFTVNGQHVDLLNLRLSFIDRNFDHRDYEALLALDENSSDNCLGSHPPTALSEQQLASLPVRQFDKGGWTLSASPSFTMDAARSHEKCNDTSPATWWEELQESVVNAFSQDKIGRSSQKKNKKNKSSSEYNRSTQHSACAAKTVETCSICLEDFCEGAMVLQLPCGHDFHADCARQWMKQKGLGVKCPNCQSEVF